MAAEDSGVHPGSWVGDSVEEFKKLPLWGKIGVGIVVLGLVAFGIYKYRQAQAASAQSAASSGSAPGGGTQSPFPMVGNLPVLPAGTNPIYDPNGNLIGYQNTPSGGPPSGPPVGPPIQPPAAGPLIPFGQYNGPSYSNLKPNTYFSWQGVNYLLSTGGGGRLYGQANGQGNKILLYEPQSQYPTPQGATANAMANPAIYTQAAMPHISSAHPAGQ